MFTTILSIAFFFMAPESTLAVISSDLNCTTYNGTAFVWLQSATICSNTISDAACAVLYPPVTAGAVIAGTDNARPASCFTTAAATPAAAVQDMKNAAIAQCPKTCGYCCQTSAYSCKNALYPSMNCATVTAAQCMSAIWRPIIATECPAACGFCNDGGCVDAIVECANDVSICNSIGLQDFVNKNCQKTCGRCAATSTAFPGQGTCSTYLADSTTSCKDWANNGFCTNNFYTIAQRKARCATTCKIC